MKGGALPVLQGTLLVLLAASVVLALTIGQADIAVGDVWQSLGFHLGLLPETPLTALRDAIIWELRLPRILAAAAIGAGLALCGAVMQALTRNPLADPYLLGLSAGASCGAVAFLLLGWGLMLPVGAFLGSAAALLITLGVARLLGGATPTRVVLGGIAVSALGASLASFLIFWSATGDSYREILSWLLGSLSGVIWSEAAIVVVATLVLGLPVLLFSRLLDAFAFGEEAAAALGVAVRQVRWAMFLATALLTGLLVAVGGSIGFVGLVVPHVGRFIAGSGHRGFIPVAMLVGALFLLWSDTAARTIFEQRELPVGVVTALVGAPLFILVLFRYRRST